MLLPPGFARTALASCVWLLASHALAQSPVAVGLEARFTVPNPSVTAITHAKDGSGRLFVTTQNGNIYVFDGSVVRSSPFLSVPTFASGEQGLLGLAFHPSYVANGFFYVYYTSFNGD